jgi:hypothetical protein
VVKFGIIKKSHKKLEGDVLTAKRHAAANCGFDIPRFASTNTIRKATSSGRFFA